MARNAIKDFLFTKTPRLSLILQFLKNLKDILRYSIFHSTEIYSLIFQVTSRCDSRCLACFNWANLNRIGKGERELSLKEIRLFSPTMGRIGSVTLGGGEPFLRMDIPEICSIFVKNNATAIFHIPTNGLNPERIYKITERITKEVNAKIAVVLSLDGLESTHDHIRGVKGNFKKVIDTYSRLVSLLPSSTFEIRVNTTLSKTNKDEIEELAKFVQKKMDYVSYHTFEVIRGGFNAELISPPSPEEYREIINKVILKVIKDCNIGPLHKKALFYYHLLTLDFLRDKRDKGRCVAGPMTPVIDPYGQVYTCEMLKPIGNLREANYDYKSIWKASLAKKILQEIREGHCRCTHFCFKLPTIYLTLGNLLRAAKLNLKAPLR